MSLNTTFSFTFYLVKSKKSSDGSCPIYLKITIEGDSVEYSTKAKINSDNWLGGKSLSTDNDLNSYLSSIERKLVNKYHELTATNKKITPQLLKAELLGIKQKEHSVISTAEYHNKQMEALIGKKFAKGTYKNYKTTLKYLKEFIPLRYKVKDILLVDLSYKFLQDYEYYLTVSKNCSNNGVMKQVQRLRKIVNLAVSNNWLDKNPFTKFKISYDRVDRGYLNVQELKAIEQLELTGKYLIRLRDYFLFSCYTGLSYADVKALSKNHINIDDGGNWWILQTRQKSHIQAQIPIIKKARTILDKYLQLSTDKVFPVASNQKVNQYLKEIAVKAGIEKKVHFHLARHTFATTVTLSNNVPLETVSKMLGHTKISTTQIYARTLKGKILADMKGIDDKLK